MNKALRDQVMQLSSDDRLELAFDLWDSLEAEQFREVSAEDIAIAQERLAEHLAHPDEAIPMEIVMAELASRLK